MHIYQIKLQPATVVDSPLADRQSAWRLRIPGKEHQGGAACYLLLTIAGTENLTVYMQLTMLVLLDQINHIF